MAGDVSARDLVKQVWDEVAVERAQRPPPDAGLSDYERLVEDGERHYVNRRYVLDRKPVADEGSAGAPSPRGVRGRVRARAGRFVVGVLRGYFDDEQEFLAHLVRLQNTITVHIDRLSQEIRQVESSLQDETERLRVAGVTLHARLEDRVRALEEEVAGLRQGGGAR